MTFEEILDATKRLLESRKRITYGALKRQFGLDDDFLEDLKAELIQGQRIAVDEEGKVLVWMGGSRATPRPIEEQGKVPNTPGKGQVPGHAQPSHQAERRQLTVMFCDLVGSTALSERLDPEDLREVIGAYQETCDQVIHRFEGTIMQFQGDGILVYFGHPVAHEDDAQRGVLAALGILDELPTLNTRLRQLCDVELSMRIGIHTGLVVVGEMGRSGWLQTVALGETLNVASRIQDLADSNTIVISEATLNLVKGFFNLQVLGEYNVKGISRSIQVWRVLGKSGVQSRFEAAGSRLTTLVGREHEIDGLLKRWEAVKEGMGQVVLLKGEAGIGKTRLVEEVKDRLRHENPTRQEYRCSPFYQNTALYPVTNFLGPWLSLGQEDTADAKLRKLEGALKHSHPKAEAVALLANLLSVPLDKSYAPLKLTPETQRQRTFEVLRALLLETSPSGPVLFIVEDLHWVDPTTLDWLTMVVNHAATARVLVILTFRPEFTPPWPERPHVATIPLNRLNGIQVGAVVKGVTGGRTLPREITEQVVNRTDGVPLFVEELTKSLLESGLLLQREHDYDLAGLLPSMTIPATLQDSLMARLDRLSTAKPVAQLGATLGREFSYELLHAVSPLEETPLQQELTRLEEAELVYREGLLPQATYMFKHALIQEAAYESLLKGTRREVHHHIAEVLERRFPATAESEPELLAHHYSKGVRPERAIPYWQQAGHRALQRAANVEAIAHFGHILNLLEHIPDKAERLQKELHCQISRGPALMYIKGYSAPEVKQSYNRAMELCESLGETKQLFGALWGQWASHFVGGDLGPARQLGEQLVRLAEKRNDPAIFPPARHAFGYPLCYRAEYHAAIKQADLGIADFDLNTEKANAIEYQFSSVTALYRFSGTALLMLGYPDDARDRAKKALELTERLGNKPNIAYAYTSSTWFHQLWRNAQRIIEDFEHVTRLPSEEQGFFWPRLGRIFYGWAHVELGQVEEGVHEMRENLDAYRAIGGGILQTHAYSLLAEGLWKLDKPREALHLLSETMETIKTSFEYHYEPELFRLTGEILRQVQGDTSSNAEVALRKAVDLSRKQKTKWLELRAMTSLCRLWQTQGKKKEALEELNKIYKWFSQGFDTKDLIEAKNLLQELGAP